MVPAHVVPDPAKQSFWPFRATPKHFSILPPSIAFIVIACFSFIIFSVSPLLIWAVADVAASDPMAAVKAPATSADSMRLDILFLRLRGWLCDLRGSPLRRASHSSPDTKFARTAERLRPDNRSPATVPGCSLPNYGKPKGALEYRRFPNLTDKIRIFGLFNRNPSSTGAAGQLCDVPSERQRCQLQALDGGEIGKDRFREVSDRKSLPDRQCGRLDAVGALRRENMRAKQPAAVRVGHELDEPAGIAGGERSRHLIETDCGDVNGVPQMTCPCFRQSHARHLRIGEHDGRHGAVVVM